MLSFECDPSGVSPSDPRFHGLVEACFDQQTLSRPGARQRGVLWGAERYGFAGSAVYESLDPERREAALEALSEGQLVLSYGIECAGMLYGAKMIQIARSFEERSLYSLFTSEESVHRREFMNFLREVPEGLSGHHPMLEALAEAMESPHRPTLLFVIQVLLEGFGLAHYRGLAEDCLDPGLGEVYRAIVRDEARHHGAGVVLFDADELTREGHDEVFELTRRMILAISEPRLVLDELEAACGAFSSAQRARFLEEIAYERRLGYRRARLRELVAKSDSFGLVERLDRDRVFG
jgi:hypothetical protein